MLCQAFLVSLVATVAAATNTSITFQDHFATEELNKAAPFHDLSEFGYIGGQLPKAYHINTTGPGLQYLPQESFNEYQKIISGLNNASTEHTTQMKAFFSTGKRSTGTDPLSLTLRGADGKADHYTITKNFHDCRGSNHGPWNYAVVEYLGDQYITFWASTECNGHKGSFNPVCGWQDRPSRTCAFNFSPKSFRVYTSCHQQHDSDGCGGGNH